MTRTINFNWKQLGRTLVCFVLICCLMVNISPLRAKAITPAALTAIKWVVGSIAISSIANAIGLAVGNTTEAFESVVSSCQTYLEGKGWIVDGLVKIGLISESDGATRAFFLRDMIEDIRSWIFDSGTVSAPVNGQYISVGEMYEGYYYDYPVRAYKTYCKTPSNTYLKFHGVVSVDPNQQVSFYTLNDSGNRVTYSPSSSSTSINGVSYYYKAFVSTTTVAVPDSSWTFVSGVSSYSVGDMLSTHTELDITLGDIASPDVSLEEGYATWSTGAVSVPNADTGEDDVYYPVSIPDSSDSVGTLTQTDAQSGTISDELVDSLVGTDTEVDTEAGTATETVTVTGFASLVQFLTGTAVVASPLEAINFGAMFDLFPFNIPAGIYETINFWSASATPPVITIPLPIVSGGGVTIDEYTLDLGEIPGMNTLAALIRGGELILFAIGLLLITRKVTKW